jgi:NAD-dependent dihydropyrimidine dehydrogenase PreA subunit
MVLGSSRGGIMIFYFSATGNTKYISERIAKETNDKIVSIGDCIDKHNLEFSFNENDTIGIVSPTYFLGLPSIVADFLRKLIVNGKPYSFFIATYGTTTGQIGRYAQKSTSQISFDSLFSVKMTDTWTPIFDLSDRKKIMQILDGVEPQLESIIKSIKEKTAGDFIKDKAPVLLTDLYYKTYQLQNRTKKFNVDGSCIGCALCEKKCPAHVIKMIENRPVWTRVDCIMCLGCLHRCPKFAIQYGKNTKSHGQYINPNTEV